MRKIFLFLIVIGLSMFLLYGQAQNTPEVQNLQPNENIPARYNGVYTGPVEDNFLIAIKVRDKDHVLVELRAWGLSYPDLEWMEDVPEGYLHSNDNLRKINNIPYFLSKMNGKYGAINEQGEIVIPFIFDKIVDFADDGYYYIIEKHNQKVIVPIDDMSCRVFNYATIGLADKTGKVIIPCEYTNIKILDKNRIYAEKFFDTKNKTFINNLKDPATKSKIRFEKYLYPNSFTFKEINDEYIVKDKKAGIINFSNKVCVPFDNYEYLLKEQMPILYDSFLPNRVSNIPIYYKVPMHDKYILIKRRKCWLY